MLFKPANPRSADIAFFLGSSAYWTVPRISLAKAIRYVFWFGGKIELATDFYHVPDVLRNKYGQVIANISASLS